MTPRKFPFHFRTAWWIVLPFVLAACASKDVKGVQKFTFAGGDHRQGRLVYDQTPPAGGAHNPPWQNCGVYTSSLYNEYAVHSLEHGAVWITYRPGLAADQVQTLAGLVKDRTHVLVSPEARQTVPVVMTAWGKQLSVDAVSDPRIGAFVERYARAAGAPEPGAPCTGGYSGAS